MKTPKHILFLGETYRADAQTWIKGVQNVSGIKIDTLEVGSTKTRVGRIYEFLVFGLKIMKSNFRRSYDLVLAERATSYGFFSLFVNSKKRIVAQQGITDAWPETGFSGFYKRFLQKLVYKKVDLIHAWGEVMVPAIMSSGAKSEKIMVLPKGMDLDNYHFLSFDKKEVNLAIVTRSLTDVYHHEDILHALSILKTKNKIVKLIVAGDGPRMEFLKSLSSDLGLENQIQFLGRVPNDQLPKLLQRASIYLSVPETEGVSASLFEAMSSGCFPIVTDLPGTRAFITHGKNGLLVPVCKPNVLAREMNEYLDHSDQFEKSILGNRAYIETSVDLKKNMQTIWERYIQTFNS